MAEKNHEVEVEIQMDSDDKNWIEQILKNNKLKEIFIITVLWSIIFCMTFFSFFQSQSLKNSIGIFFATIVCAFLISTLSCYQSLNDLPKNKIGRKIRSIYLRTSISSISIFLIYIPMSIWIRLHNQPVGFIQFSSLLLFLLIFMAAMSNIIEDNSNKAPDSTIWKVIQKALLPILPLPIFIIISLLILDLTSFFTNANLDLLYPTPEVRNFLFTLYTGSLASIVFGVTLYVAYIRHTSFKLAEKQFLYTQTQKHEEEIEKRFQEGIKLLGNDQESVRLGGIFVLWEIVKDAVKALPYLENEHIYYAENTNDKKQTYILPYRLKEADKNLDTADQIELKKRYLKDHPSSDAQLGAYSKAFSLHEQILNIFCAYIRTKTNHENYIKENYPSIYQKRYSHKFKEAFGKKGEFNHIEDRIEKPSHEIQSLLDLLLKMPNKKKIQEFIPGPINIPVQVLDFQLNLTQAILKGGDFNNACFTNSSCDGTNFQYAHCINTIFENASCIEANFKKANCYAASFHSANCHMANFQSAECSMANFQEANCHTTNLKNANCGLATFKEANCYYINFKNAECSMADFQEADCLFAKFQNARFYDTNFIGANCSLAGFQNATFHNTNFQKANFVETNFKNTKRSRANFEGARNLTLYTLSLFT